MKTVWAFVVLIGALFVACLLSGCAKMNTRQSDLSHAIIYEIGEDGRTNSITVDNREIRTSASGGAFVSSSQGLKGFKASQTDKTQGLTISEAQQRSDIDRLVDLMDRLGARAAAAYGIPSPPAASTVPAAPPGRKWVLVPTDDPSVPQEVP